MEEKNELNDIILNKSGSNSGSKKLLLAIATFTLILIIVLVIMNSLKNDEVQKSPQAILPPEPTAPTEIINDPLFEPVEVIQEGNETAKAAAPQGATDLNQIAQKIKNESMQNTPVVQNKVIESVPASAPVAKATAQSAPVKKSTPVATRPAPKVNVGKVAAKTQPIENTQKSHGTAVIKQEKNTPAKIVEPKKPVQEATAPTPAKVATEAKITEVKSAPVTSAAAPVTYYIQVGSFTNEPNKALFDRLNASGMKYTTQKSGSVTKVLVGPFQGEKSVQDAMGSIRQNVEAKAFKIKG
ncbi:MAG: SPOR domain-containing protein [Sulfuricurvum sp.]|nr:SPOR domain-containing protein [Sulfuricurvum sp.]